MGVNLTPGPVVDEAAIAAHIKSGAAVLVAVGAIVAPGVDLSGAGDVAVAAFTGLVVLLNYSVGVWRAYRARRNVTPLVNPRNDLGQLLEPRG
jgi:hypothetical protein